ncbi:hypothetical protein [Oceanobacillus salinisoli]|uniref:hypothetical protein n=1 Tax=Oceanobacillus salinisoli TaxID=2678611 RepID=UPI0012E1EBE3|nr:hypothetical protein [Oceanobacillus salinisoli]
MVRDFYWKHTGEGLWIMKEKDLYSVGLTMEVLTQLEDITFLDLLSLDEIQKDEPFLHVESRKAVHEFPLPLSGKLTKINNKMMDEPELLNELTWVVMIDSISEEEFMKLEHYKPQRMKRKVG